MQTAAAEIGGLIQESVRSKRATIVGLSSGAAILAKAIEEQGIVLMHDLDFDRTMNTYIALLRGVNVGGNNKLGMADLARLLTDLGLQDVKTYIQSGNVVFQSEETDTVKLSQAITGAIRQSHGFAPYVLILDKETLEAVLAANPFPEGEAEPKSLHLFFMDGVPLHYDMDALDRLKAPDERYQLIGHVFYLHAPSGIGRSKLATAAGKGWRVNITARNWRTVSEVMALARQAGTKKQSPTRD